MKTHHKNTERLVTKVFQDVFDKYDLMNDLMSFGIHRFWKKNFINWLNPQQNTTLIDMASGTGDVAKLYLDKVNFNGQVYCVDENKEMLNLNRKKLNENKNVKWLCGNAEKLPFKNNYFDYYTISFGIRNISNINKALQEAYRVLKPGGRFLCLEFSKVENEILNKFYKVYSKSIPQLGKFIIGKSEPYEYLVNSIEKFYSQEIFFQKIKEQNFVNISYRNLNGGIVAIHSAWKI
ncbi:MAG: bifunctional demethylmenaquinone methyltransferase/2-methoxy-6-polyprenyl-1,4-benzoquinol methylase UbiE [Candidatus Pelagibacterales bacterium]|nr:MAG: bifunctional demethylmenaquinone methyltransferase/2-methoxy-6-polyprenyl-1,4-benzoquinol methylase UbiE [Pelagibacterales bacterium]